MDSTTKGRNTTAPHGVSSCCPGAIHGGQELFHEYQEAADAAKIVDDQRHLRDLSVQRAILEAEEELRLLDLQMSSTKMEASIPPRPPADHQPVSSSHGMCDSMHTPLGTAYRVCDSMRSTIPRGTSRRPRHTPLGTAYQVCESMRSTIPRGTSRRPRNRQSSDPTTQSGRAQTRRSEWRDPLHRNERLGPPSTPTIWVEILNELSADGFVAESDLTPETVTKLKRSTQPSHSGKVAPRRLF